MKEKMRLIKQRLTGGTVGCKRRLESKVSDMLTLDALDQMAETVDANLMQLSLQPLQQEKSIITRAAQQIAERILETPQLVASPELAPALSPLPPRQIDYLARELSEDSTVSSPGSDMTAIGSDLCGMEYDEQRERPLWYDEQDIPMWYGSCDTIVPESELCSVDELVGSLLEG